MSDYILELEEACNTLKKHCEQEKCNKDNKNCIFYTEKLPYCCLMSTPPEVWPVDKIFNKEE